jgi:hypothetical protein
LQREKKEQTKLLFERSKRLPQFWWGMEGPGIVIYIVRFTALVLFNDAFNTFWWEEKKSNKK